MAKRIEKIKKRLKELKPMLVEKYKIKSIGVFGSYVRGEQKKASDLDILVEFEETADISLFDFIDLENYLSDIFGIKVDLGEKCVLKPRIGAHILKELVAI